MSSYPQSIRSYQKQSPVPPDNSVPCAVGEEGFYPAGDANAAKYNPGEEFSTTSGQDFVKNHSPDTIDFAATHLWIGAICSPPELAHLFPSITNFPAKPLERMRN